MRPALGPRYLDPSTWTPVLGPQYLDPSTWTPVLGPQYLDASTDPSWNQSGTRVQARVNGTLPGLAAGSLRRLFEKTVSGLDQGECDRFVGDLQPALPLAHNRKGRGVKVALAGEVLPEVGAATVVARQGR